MERARIVPTLLGKRQVTVPEKTVFLELTPNRRLFVSHGDTPERARATPLVQN